MMKVLKKINMKIWILVGIFLLLPILGSVSAFDNSDYDVDPTEYSINVHMGEYRVYMFGHVHSSIMDEYGYMTEIKEFKLSLEIDGQIENITINEGTKVTVEVTDINQNFITLQETYFILDGPMYTPDPVIVNRSNLLLLSDTYRPRFIMTINQDLINQVYGSNTEWIVEHHPEWNSVEFRKDFNNESYSYHENYEYDMHDGFLRHMSVHYNTENGGWFDFGFHQTFYAAPEDYQLGVGVGSSRTYLLETVRYYDFGQDVYYDDMGISVYQDGMLKHYNIHEGDKIHFEIVGISEEYVRFAVTYMLQDGSEIKDEAQVILDKSTGYFSLQFMFGQPILLTTNESLIWQLLPMDFYFTETEIVCSNSWEDPNWKQKEEGTWDLATGWLNYYHRVEFENDQLRHEFGIVATGYNYSEIEFPEFTVGVSPGDRNTLEFMEIMMKGEDGTVTNTLPIEFGEDKSIEMAVGDQIEIYIQDVNGYHVSLEMTFHSSISGETMSDSWTTDISKLPEGESDGPIFIIPTDEQFIKNLFEGFGNVTITEDRAFVKIVKHEENNTIVEECEYDLKTGWILKITQSEFVDGNEVEFLVAESIEITSNPFEAEEKDSESLPSLTPIPLWPTLLFLLGAALIYRKKR